MKKRIKIIVNHEWSILHVNILLSFPSQRGKKKRYTGKEKGIRDQMILSNTPCGACAAVLPSPSCDRICHFEIGHMSTWVGQTKHKTEKNTRPKKNGKKKHILIDIKKRAGPAYVWWKNTSQPRPFSSPYTHRAPICCRSKPKRREKKSFRKNKQERNERNA